MPTKKRLGTGAQCEALIRMLHPAKTISEVLINRAGNERLTGLIAIGREMKRVNRREQICVTFRHDSFPNETLYCAVRFCKVVTEGDPVNFFLDDDAPTADADAGATAANTGADGNTGEDRQEIPDGLTASLRATSDDIALMRGMGFDVDDDNDPAPENVPGDNQQEASDDGLYEGQSWGWQGFCDRRKNNMNNTKPKLRVPESIFAGMTYITMFLLMFPKQLLEVIVSRTSKQLEKNGNTVTSLGEFLRFLGLQMFMSTQTGFSRRDYWSGAPVTLTAGAPFRLNEFMPRNRFEQIMEALTFTDVEPPSYVDKFWEVRQMIDLWNNNMEEVFCPSWVVCLDESMSIWNNKWTCPGWV